ncbi:MAG: tail fiber protein [Elainellaceae cyanobacterium]
MAIPTLQNGDLWDESLANSSIRPSLDGQNIPGHGPKVVNDWLSDDPDQIKAHFYNWRDRMKLSVASGLTLNYSGCKLRIADGSIVTINSGSLVLPDDSSGYVFIKSDQTVSSGSELPDECQPLANFTTASGEITQLKDLRYQTVEEIRPIRLPEQVSPFKPGDFKQTFRTSLESGWLLCDGASYSTTLYPALFAAIGYTYGGSGNSFNVPDLRGRVPVGVGQGAGLTDRQLGQSGGEEAHKLTVAEMPQHGHGVSDAGHTHSLFDPGHLHTITQTPHDHNINDPGHRHEAEIMRRAANNPDAVDGAGAEASIQGTGRLLRMDKRQTGIKIQNAYANVSVNAAKSNLAVNGAFSGITVSANGGNASHNNMQPYTVCNYVIKT